MAIDTPDFLQLTQLAAVSLLGTVSIVGIGQVGIGAFTPSPFATGLIIVPQASNLLLSNCKVTGAVTNNKYVSVLFDLTTVALAPVVCAIPGNLDAPYTVTVTAVADSSGTTPIAYVYQMFGTGVQWVQAPAVQPLHVALVPLNNQSIIEQQLESLHVSTNQAAGASTTLLAGISNARVVVYGYDLSTTPVAGAAGQQKATVEDTTAAVVVAALRMQQVTAAGLGTVARALSIPQGLPLPVGAGIKLVADVGNAANLLTEGTILYTQLAVV